MAKPKNIYKHIIVYLYYNIYTYIPNYNYNIYIRIYQAITLVNKYTWNNT